MRYGAPLFVLLALLASPRLLFSADNSKGTIPPASPADNSKSQCFRPLLPCLRWTTTRRSRRLISRVCGWARSSPISGRRARGSRWSSSPIRNARTPTRCCPTSTSKTSICSNFSTYFRKQTLPQLSIEGVGGQQGPICLLKVGAPAGMAPSGWWAGRWEVMGYMAIGGMGGGKQPPLLQVYRLSPLIPAGAADRKASLNDILSLVQAALEAQGSASNVLMKVHEGTGTLIFRGNAAQTEVVERALKALAPTTAESDRAKLEEHLQAERERMQERFDQRENRLREAEMESNEARKRISQQMTEIEVLKARLAAQGDKKP